MIPTTQVLCDILNDPAIPAEAKPSGMRGNDYVPRGEYVVDRDLDDDLVDYRTPVDTANAALYWSLSAWLWERGVFPRVEVHGSSAMCPWAKGMDYGLASRRTPVEALAAVVREVAGLGVKA